MLNNIVKKNQVIFYVLTVKLRELLQYSFSHYAAKNQKQEKTLHLAVLLKISQTP